MLLGFLSETLLENVRVSETSVSSPHELEEHRHAVCLSWLVSRHLFELRPPLSEELIFHLQPVMMDTLPAAAAGSRGVFLSSAPGLKGVFGAKGLRLRCVSEALLVGERERRSLSKREMRFTSGSVWSNLERFETFRSSSAMLSSYILFLLVKVSFVKVVE